MEVDVIYYPTIFDPTESNLFLPKVNLFQLLVSWYRVDPNGDFFSLTDVKPDSVGVKLSTLTKQKF
jgi:hypothetical protein